MSLPTRAALAGLVLLLLSCPSTGGGDDDDVPTPEPTPEPIVPEIGVNSECARPEPDKRGGCEIAAAVAVGSASESVAFQDVLAEIAEVRGRFAHGGMSEEIVLAPLGTFADYATWWIPWPESSRLKGEYCGRTDATFTGIVEMTSGEIFEQTSEFIGC